MKDPLTWAIAVCIVLYGFQQCGLPVAKELMQCSQQRTFFDNCICDGEEIGAIP